MGKPQSERRKRPITRNFHWTRFFSFSFLIWQQQHNNGLPGNSRKTRRHRPADEQRIRFGPKFAQGISSIGPKSSSQQQPLWKTFRRDPAHPDGRQTGLSVSGSHGPARLLTLPDRTRVRRPRAADQVSHDGSVSTQYRVTSCSSSSWCATSSRMLLLLLRYRSIRPSQAAGHPSRSFYKIDVAGSNRVEPMRCLLWHARNIPNFPFIDSTIHRNI